MPVNLEQIDMLRERANVSYNEAKETLEKCNGDVLEALIMLEAQEKVKHQKTECCESDDGKSSHKILKTVKKLIKKGNETKFVIRKAEKTVINLPVNIVVIIAAITLPVTVGGVLLAMVTNHKIRFVKPDGEDMKINKTFDKVSSCVTSVSNQVVAAVKED